MGDDVGENIDLSLMPMPNKLDACPLIIVLITIQRLQHKSRVYYTTTFLVKELLLVFTQQPYLLALAALRIVVAHSSLSPPSLRVVHRYCGRQSIQLLLLVFTQ